MNNMDTTKTGFEPSCSRVVLLIVKCGKSLVDDRGEKSI